MTLAEALAEMRRKASPAGGPELPVHLLVGECDRHAARWGVKYAGFACDLDGTRGVRAPLYCRTTDPAHATCPACVEAAPAFTTKEN